MNSKVTERIIRGGQRASGIELLKIVAMLLIVVCHSVPHYPEINNLIDLHRATDNVQQMILLYFYYGGQLGNILFIVCSAYFLLDSNKVKMHKIMYMIADCFFFSLVFLALAIISGYDVTSEEIVKSFLPITFDNNWFIGCYILLYAVHPILNSAINLLSKRDLLIVVASIAFVFWGVEFIYHSTYRYSNFVGFLCIYIFVAYVKKYLPDLSQNLKSNTIILGVSTAGFVISLLLTNFLGLHVKVFANELLRYCNIKNLLLILIAISLFNIFNRLVFYNYVINYIAGGSLLIYIIHRNIFVKNYFEVDFYQWVYREYSFQGLVFWVFIVAIGLIVGSLTVSSLYRETLQKGIRKLTDWIDIYVIKIVNILINILLKFG